MTEAVNPLELLVGSATATIPELLAARVQSTPEAQFLRWHGRVWNYLQALEEARRFSGWALEMAFATRGPKRIASFLPNRPEAVWTWFGSLLSGAVYVPLNRAHRGEILVDMIARSGAEILVTDVEGRELLPPIEGTDIRTLLVIDAADEYSGGDEIRQASWAEVSNARELQGPLAQPEDVAELIYTSGTTGRSKAVLIPHNYLCRGAGWVAWSLGMQPDDVMHAWLPLNHIGGQIDSILALVVAGGSCALYPTFSRSRFWVEVEESGATVFVGFSNVAQMLWSLPERDSDRACSLRAGIIGGIPPELHRRFEERFGVRLFDVYGMTEAEPLVLPSPRLEYPVGSCGIPNPDMDVVILDEDDNQVAPGEIGEIAFRPRVPDVMTRGYEGDAAATLSAMRNLWFHTGDLGRKDGDGFIYFVERKKHAIRRRGENISSFELEQIVARHPAVAECCAVGVPSPLGDEDVKIVVVPRSGVAIDPVELHAWCGEQMAAFMVPRYIEVMEQLPRSAIGKVAKESLRRPGKAWDAPDGGRTAGPTDSAG